MAKFKVIVASSDGTTKSIEIEGSQAQPLIGKKIGETINGTIIGLAGKSLIITGGSDSDGFPMRPDVHGGIKKRVLLSSGAGFKPKRKGARKRKAVRGNTITDNIFQINLKVTD
jgi:small subunit ribosomal protein S6e